MSRAGRIWELEQARYLIVGVGNTAFSYVLFLILLVATGPALQALAGSESALLSAVGKHYYIVAQWTAWVLTVPVSTFTMRHLVFRKGGGLPMQIARAYFIYLPAQALATVLLWFTVQVLLLSPPLGMFLTLAAVTVFSYLGHKYFTFHGSPAAGVVPVGNRASEEPGTEAE